MSKDELVFGLKSLKVRCYGHDVGVLALTN